ncbi:MAG: hypothetical protein ACREJQ_08955 [bacterium]
MGHAYTPGLKVSKRTVIKKERTLPLKGNVLVKAGQRVNAEDIVAKTELPGNVEIVKVAQRLGVHPEELPHMMVKKVGETVKVDEAMARTAGIFGMFKTELKSPVEGNIESISSVTGQVVIRGAPIPVQVPAYVDGIVTKVYPEEGVEAATVASFIQGIFGIGGETWGTLKLGVSSPDAVLTDKEIDASMKGCVVVAGSMVTLAAIRKAAQAGVKAIVSGGINDKDLREILGYDIGVAVTGSEEIGLTLAVTEGFGRLRMAQRTYDRLKERQGARASVNGATQIRAGVLRPEIIIPYPEFTESDLKSTAEVAESGILEVGTPLRIIREPYFGQIGHVTALPVELTQIPTESKVRVLEVELEGGRRVTLPRANVEIFLG